MNYIPQIIIALITTTLGSILSYVQATKKFKTDLETVKINSNTEIEKIKEEANKTVKEIETQCENEIKTLKATTEEQIKLKQAESDISSKQGEESLKNEAVSLFLKLFMDNPEKGMETIKSLQELSTMFNQK